MNLNHFSLVLGASLLLGCGAGGIAVDGSDSASETGDGDGDPGDGDGDPGDGDPGDGDGDVPVGACIDDGQLARALAIVDTQTRSVRIYEPGGAELVLPAPLPEGIEADANLQAVTSPGFIAVTTSYSIYLQPGVIEMGSVLRLFDRHTGTLLWAHEFVDRQLGPVYVDAEGQVVARHGWSVDLQPSGGLMVIDGELTDLPNFAPAGPLGSADWMPGWIVDDQGEYLGGALYQPFSDELIEATDGPSWRPGDQSLEYIDDNGTVPEWVLTEPDASTRIELSPFAGLEGSMQVVGLAGDYRLLSLAPGNDAPPVLVRLQVSTQELLELDITPPPGLEPFDCYFPNTTVDAVGRILVELRDAGAAQIHAWDPDAGVWTALGVPMTSVDDVSIEGRFGRVEVIRGHGTGMTYCPYAEWSDPPGNALASSSLQLARVEPPFNMSLNAQTVAWVSVDPSERCATWFEVGENGQMVHDIDDGDELTLAVSGATLWLD
jgi:hypothetical protein